MYPEKLPYTGCLFYDFRYSIIHNIGFIFGQLLRLFSYTYVASSKPDEIVEKVWFLNLAYYICIILEYFLIFEPPVSLRLASLWLIKHNKKQM